MCVSAALVLTAKVMRCIILWSLVLFVTLHNVQYYNMLQGRWYLVLFYIIKYHVFYIRYHCVTCCACFTYNPAEFASLHTNVSQMPAAMTRFKSTRPVTRFTKTEFVGLQQSTDVCLTTPLWPSLMTTFADTFPTLCCRTRRGLAWWSRGGLGQVYISRSLITIT